MVDRYFPDIKWVAAQPFRRMGIDNEIEGGYVIYRDYAKLEAENKRLKDEIENWKIAHSDLLESIKRREDRDRAAVKMLRTTKEKISEINDSICEAGAILL